MSPSIFVQPPVSERCALRGAEVASGPGGLLRMSRLAACRTFTLPDPARRRSVRQGLAAHGASRTEGARDKPSQINRKGGAV